ncbi:hypothetical protein SL003B_1139 [Polymorphum gilvum SL003B-26A1]|uniref:Uncharacterized protein n=1 Tax=Polymorphum gilvum (strain LMG 25793 / CGMCC 1.9160 / SL003B-26A1) TaxID=991905 RepID=F2IZL1_POLGS|nr:hypothetical protein SL003B_1139 [Polymorphum gilvum SL003B-26A1]
MHLDPAEFRRIEPHLEPALAVAQMMNDLTGDLRRGSLGLGRRPLRAGATEAHGIGARGTARIQGKRLQFGAIAAVLGSIRGDGGQFRSRKGARRGRRSRAVFAALRPDACLARPVGADIAAGRGAIAAALADPPVRNDGTVKPSDLPPACSRKCAGLLPESC